MAVGDEIIYTQKAQSEDVLKKISAKTIFFFSEIFSMHKAQRCADLIIHLTPMPPYNYIKKSKKYTAFNFFEINLRKYACDLIEDARCNLLVSECNCQQDF